MNKNLNLDDLDKTNIEKPINLIEIINKYLTYWKWILASVVLATIVGFIFYRTQHNDFELNATLLISDNSSGQVSQMSILKQLDAFGVSGTASSNIYNENQVIQSKELIKKVVQELKLYNTYTTKSFLKPIELYNSTPVEVEMDYNHMLSLRKPIRMDVKYDEDKFDISGEYDDEEFSITSKKLPVIIQSPAGPIVVKLTNQDSIPDKKINIEIKNPLSVAKYYKESALKSEVAADGEIINLTLNEKNSAKGKDILRKIIELYNQDAIDQINKSANFTALFIDERLKSLTSELEGIEQNIQNYKQKNGLTNIETDANLILQRSNLYDQQSNEIKIQLQLIEFVEDFLSKPTNKYALIPNLGLTDVGLVSVIQEYNKLLFTREKVANGSSESNPSLKYVENQIDLTRKSISNSISISRKGLQISSRELDHQNKLLNAQIEKIPQQEREFLEIKRQQQIKESLYLFLLQKREEASLSMAVTTPKGRLLDAPDSADLVSPKFVKIMAAFIFLGFLLPILFLYLKFLLTTTFSDRKEVETLTKVPIIAELAHQKTTDVIIDHGTNASANAELLRLLRSKLQFIMNRPKDRLILVTSTESGEGKTFVSINLAVSISLTNKKVLLIGMDLRKPMLAHHFGINQQEGITSYLSGIEPDYKKLICQTPEFPDLYLLHGGIIPPNPNELILSERFDQLIAELREQYDYIIIDSAPVGAVSDTFLINRVSNLTLYICRANYSDKRNLEFLDRINNENSLKQIYLVINDVEIEVGKYGGKYAYGYGYGYGYGKKRTKKI